MMNHKGHQEHKEEGEEENISRWDYLFLLVFLVFLVVQFFFFISSTGSVDQGEVNLFIGCDMERFQLLHAGMFAKGGG